MFPTHLSCDHFLLALIQKERGRWTVRERTDIKRDKPKPKKHTFRDAERKVK